MTKRQRDAYLGELRVSGYGNIPTSVSKNINNLGLRRWYFLFDTTLVQGWDFAATV